MQKNSHKDTFLFVKGYKLITSLNFTLPIFLPTERSSQTRLESRKGNLERSIKVGNDILDVLDTNGHSNQVRRDSRIRLLLLRKLRVRCRRGVDNQGFGITDVGQVTGEFEAVDGLASGGSVTLDTEGEDTTKVTLAEVLFGDSVGFVIG